MGMESGTIPDENIQASSTAGSFSRAWHARLNGKYCWFGAYTDTRPWIQADIGCQTNVSGVVTQGNGGHTYLPDDNVWVTSILVSTFSLSTNDTEVFVADEQGTFTVSNDLRDHNWQKKNERRFKGSQLPEIECRFCGKVCPGHRIYRAEEVCQILKKAFLWLWPILGNYIKSNVFVNNAQLNFDHSNTQSYVAQTSQHCNYFQ